MDWGIEDRMTGDECFGSVDLGVGGVYCEEGSLGNPAKNVHGFGCVGRSDGTSSVEEVPTGAACFGFELDDDIAFVSDTKIAEFWSVDLAVCGSMSFAVYDSVEVFGFPPTCVQ